MAANSPVPPLADPFNLTLLGRGYIAHHTREVKAKVSAVNVVDNRCIHSEYVPGTISIVCKNYSNQANHSRERVRQGWTCEIHEPRESRKKLGSSGIIVVDGDRLVETDRQLIEKGSGARIGSRDHLLCAAIYRADGSPKFPW